MKKLSVIGTRLSAGQDDKMTGRQDGKTAGRQDGLRLYDVSTRRLVVRSSSPVAVLSSCLVLLAAPLMAQEDSAWSISAGVGIRTGMKITGKGGTFDAPTTGFVRAKPSDPGAALGMTPDWGVDDAIVGGAQIHIPDGRYTGIGGEDLYYMSYTSADGAKSATAMMPSFEIGIGRDLIVEEEYTLGMRLSLGGSIGLNKEVSATATRYTHVFAETVTLADPPLSGTSHVEIAPRASAPGESTQVKVSGSLWKMGVGPELSLQDTEYTGIGLSLHPYISLNSVSMKVDGEQKDAGGATLASVSSTKNSMLFGGGISATVFYDITDNWTLGGSVGYDYLPKMELGDGNLGADVALSAITVGATVTWRF